MEGYNCFDIFKHNDIAKDLENYPKHLRKFQINHILRKHQLQEELMKKKTIMKNINSRRRFIYSASQLFQVRACGLPAQHDLCRSKPLLIKKKVKWKKENWKLRGVSEFGAGCMSISANYGPPADKSQGLKVIREAYERE